MNTKEIGQVIKSRRRDLKIKQQELADLAGVNINTIVAIERGVGNPKIETLLAICEVLGLQSIVKLKD
ncbi:MAG: helix-turn-helix domain-containing protein [Bacteroidales bacterium]|nr:helix-turn-helix domain-containing protein [Bacteroidales bacterium]